MLRMDDLSVFQYSCSQLLSNYPTYNSIAYPKVKESPEAFMIQGVEKVLDIYLQYPSCSLCTIHSADYPATAHDSVPSGCHPLSGKTGYLLDSSERFQGFDLHILHPQAAPGTAELVTLYIKLDANIPLKTNLFLLTNFYLSCYKAFSILILKQEKRMFFSIFYPKIFIRRKSK